MELNRMQKPEWSQLAHKSFYFIRHGQTDWNAEHKAMGITDIPLNKVGEEQSRQALSLLNDLDIKHICYSPLKRAFKTAEILNEKLQCKMTPLDDLKEFNLGNFAGTVIDDWFDQWMVGKCLPGGETFQAFIERAIRGVNTALKKDGPILIVAHGGIYWAIQRAINRLDLPDLANCCLVSFKATANNEAWDCVTSSPQQQPTQSLKANS